MISLRPTANRRFNELVGLLLLVAAALLLLALVSYHPTDPSPDTVALVSRPANFVGPAGAWGADLLFQSFGLAAFLWAFGLAGWARHWFRSGRRAAPTTAGPLGGAGWRSFWTTFAGLCLCVLSFAALLGEVAAAATWRGAAPLAGASGLLLGGWMDGLFSSLGAVILTLTGLVAGLFLCTSFSFAAARDWTAERVWPPLAAWLRPALAPLLAPFLRLAAWRRERRARAEAARRERADRRATALARRADIATRFIPSHRRMRGERDGGGAELAATEMAAGESAPEVALVPASVAARLAAHMAAEVAAPSGRRAAAGAAEASRGDAARADAAKLDVAQVVVAPRPDDPSLRPSGGKAATARVPAAWGGNYKLPPPGLLQEPGAGEHLDEAELRELAAALTAKCEEFDVRGQITQINPGPVVTTYEYKPEAGIKYSRITSLNEDLCLALEAESIYIERIPGKSTIGIEVPNRKRETIYLREVVESREFHDSASPLTMALGKDIAGRIITTDLAAMPHLLIAGSTGSGKSVALNAIIVSLLYKSTPDEVRLILVDPKRLELGLYDGIPHLYTPIITEPKLAAHALRNATREMERRLKLLAARGVRNIAQYNRLFEKETPGLFDRLEDDADQRPLPYIVIVIDELADLMIVDANNVEESITRLAQMARAVGIHLILATQRPSVDVITGLIKANFPARVSFRVATKVDSRTILDAQGAESLLGKGDMLFLPPGTSRLQRVHGAFVTEREITGVVDFWGKQAAPQFDESFLKPPAEERDGADADGGEGATGGDDNDPMFEDAVRVVLEYGKASTSLLQRRLRIGYGRAAHLIDLMHNDGIVGPADGPKPRELLKRPDWLAEVESAPR